MNGVVEVLTVGMLVAFACAAGVVGAVATDWAFQQDRLGAREWAVMLVVWGAVIEFVAAVTLYAVDWWWG